MTRLYASVCLITLLACPSFAQAPIPLAHAAQRGICAAPMPPGFDWPANSRRLYEISGGFKSGSQNIPGSIDVVSQRRHGWMLFAGATQRSSAAADALPVFHTWYTVEETFDATPGKVDCTTRRPILRLSAPTQMLIELDNPIRKALEEKGFTVSPRFDPNPSLVTAPTPAAEELLEPIAFSHVAFNKEMYDFIRDNRYYLNSELQKLVDANKARVPIKDPPLNGISLKFAWWPVAPDKLTPLPVWDFDPRFPGDAKNYPQDWKRVVAVDAKGGQKSPASIRLGKYDHPNPPVVGLDKFYAVQLSAEEAELANADFRLDKAAKVVLGRSLNEGDYLVLTALHIATREFDPWVFTTFWWTDKPNVGPLASDMPAEVTGIWRNYVMDVSYNINNPKGADGKAPVSYNPWLELFQLGGTRSQCMACHARAAFGQGVKASFNPPDMSTKDPNGFEGTPIDADDPAYKPGSVSLHRIWTILTRAR